MLIKLDYHPSPPQRRFHETDSDEALFGGEVGSGKTKALVMDALFMACRFPGIALYTFRGTYKEGEDTILEEIERSYPKEIGYYSKIDTTFYYVNGSKLKLRQCKTIEDAKKNDSKEFGILYVDEPQGLSFEVFDYLCTRVRANKKLGVKPQVKLTAMQGGKGHAWIKRNLVDPCIATPNRPVEITVVDDRTGEKFIITREFIPAATRDNKYVDDGYIARMNARSEKLRRKLLTYDWNAIEGQAFREWVDRPYLDSERKQPNYRNTHVVPDFPIPEHWPIFRGYDYGRAKPYSFLWFTRGDETYGGRLFLIRELYGGKEDESGMDEPVSKQAEKALIIERAFVAKHGYVEGVADPSIFAKSPWEDESIASMMGNRYDEETGELIREGIEFLDPRYEKSVAQNIINNRLQGKELIHEALIFDGAGFPGFQVFESCAQFRKHFPELVVSPKNPDDVDSEDTADHDYDAFRYVVMLTKPRAKKIVDIPKRRRWDPLDVNKDRRENDGKLLEIKVPEIM